MNINLTKVFMLGFAIHAFSGGWIWTGLFLLYLFFHKFEFSRRDYYER